jgi:hypothetical protein
VDITVNNSNNGTPNNTDTPNNAPAQIKVTIELINQSKQPIDLTGWTLNINDKKLDLPASVLGTGKTIKIDWPDQDRIELLHSRDRIKVKDASGKETESLRLRF